MLKDQDLLGWVITKVKTFYFPIITSIAFIIVFFVIFMQVNAYFEPLGGVGGTWRPEEVRSVKSALRMISKTWDANHFTEIARDSYRLDKDSNYAFFPLFPLQIRLVSFVLDVNPYIGATFTGWMNFVLFTLILYLFLKKYCEVFNINISIEITLLICLTLPFAFFFVTPYSESLFMVFLLGLFYIMFFVPEESKLKWLMPILSLGLGLTRSVSVVFGLTLVMWAFWNTKAWAFFKKPLEWVKQSWKKIILYGITGLTLTAGVTGFMYYGHKSAGNFWKTTEVQKYWKREDPSWNIFAPIVEDGYLLFVDHVELKKKCGGYVSCVWGYVYPFSASIIFFISLFLVLVFIPWKDSRNATMIAHSLFSLILPLTTGTTYSLNRFLIVTPLYIILVPVILSKKLPSHVLALLIALMSISSAVFLVLFSLHQWVG